MNKYLVGGCLLALMATSCASKGNQQEKENASSQQTITADRMVQVKPEYAEGFQLTYADGYVLVDIHDPQNEESTHFLYALVPRGTKPEGLPADYTVIETPVRSAICMTSLQLTCSSPISLSWERRIRWSVSRVRAICLISLSMNS